MTDNEVLYLRAHQAGIDAANACTPRAMTVSGGGQSWFVPEGPCGFAWITVKPANAPFARYLTSTRRAEKAYEGGVKVWVSAYNQSHDRKAAYARAFARVLVEAGVRAVAGSRLD